MAQNQPHKELGLKLLSPEFKPRPGWGGKLAEWYRNSGKTVLIRLGILVAIPIVLAPIFNRSSPLLGTSQEPEVTPPQVISVTITAGDGLIHGARTALYEYMAIQLIPLSLSPEQYVFAEDWIARRMSPYVPEPGETLTFPHEVLSAAIMKAQTLTPEERASWLRFVK